MSRLVKFVWVLCSLALTCLLYGFLIEPKFLKTRQLRLEVDSSLDASVRIALVSDLHIGGLHVPAERIKTIVTRVNELNPDIILIPGDFIDGHEKRENHNHDFNVAVRNGLASLKELKAPLGVYASIGNHDVWYDAPFVKQSLEAHGLTVLQNTAVNVSNNFCILGFADHDTQLEDDIAYEACEDGGAVIALMHSPDSFAFLRSDTVLAVAGHTHGGQINIPLIGRRVTATSAGRKYAYGLVDVNGIPAFVTAGIGTSILPARFRSPPEIVFIDLVPK